MSETKELPPNQMWQHRLLQLDYLPAGELASRFNLLNPRSHPEAQKDATESSLEKVQWIDEVSLSTNGDGPPSLADNPDAVLFDGHERVEIVLARFGPDALVPVKWYRLNKEETDFALLVKDQTTGMAEYIPGKLAELMERTKAMTNDPRLAGMLDRLKQQAGVNGKGQAGNDAEPQIDKAAELKEKWGVCLGQVWELPSLVEGRPHRIVCGDCTDRVTVERVMRGEQFDLMVTDPPYGVDYEGGRNPNQSPREKLSGDSSPALYDTFLSVWKNYRAEKGVLYIWFADRGGKPVYNSIEGAGFTIRALIIWNKIDPHYGNFMAQYLQKHEPCLYCVNGSTNWYGPTNEVTVWDIKQPNINEFHPTQKPLECMIRPMNNSSKEGDLVCDPFLGSGTTLIAAHNLGRICYGCELDEGYTGVILERYHKATGLLPTLIDQGAR